MSNSTHKDFIIENGVLVKYTGSDTEVIIPDGVTSINEHAFYRCDNITSVSIPDSVKDIGSFAFAHCENLCSIIIPEGVTDIQEYTFYGCNKLTTVTIPDSVTNIEERAFYQCPIDSIKLPDNLTTIGLGAFEWTGLKSIVIPDSVEVIGAGAFYDCALESVTIGKGVTIMGSGAFEFCDLLDSVHITDLVKWCDIDFKCGGVYESVDGTLANPLMYAKKLYINEELTTDIVIPNGVTSINNYAFDCCKAITSVTIPDGVTNVGENAFYGCANLNSITIGKDVTSIGDWAFECKNLMLIDVNENNPNYSSQDGVLFNKDKTTLIQYPAEKTTTSYKIPDSVTSIDNRAFYGCKNLASITIPDSVTSIGEEAFRFCSNLTSVTIGKNVTKVDAFDFYCSDNLKEIHFTSPDTIITGDIDGYLPNADFINDYDTGKSADKEIDAPTAEQPNSYEDYEWE